jgi:hypothetical protein
VRVFFGLLGLLLVAGLLLTAATAVWPSPNHVLFGLLTALEGLLLDCFLLFHFVGTGNWVRRVVPPDDARRGEFLARVRGYRRGFFPLLGVSMLLWIATTTTGGASLASRFPGWIHGAVGALAAGLGLWAWRLGTRRVGDSLGFLGMVEARVQGTAAHPGEGTLQEDRSGT